MDNSAGDCRRRSPAAMGRRLRLRHPGRSSLVLVLTVILVLGMKLSARVTAVVVAIKVAVVLLVIVAGLFFIKAANYNPFIPPAQPQPTGAAARTRR